MNHKCSVAFLTHWIVRLFLNVSWHLMNAISRLRVSKSTSAFIITILLFVIYGFS